MTLAERLEKINLDWFLMEPALHKVLCSHQVVANVQMKCPMRCGKGRIEYQPLLCNEIDDMHLAELMKIECVRILLKHPYERQPSDCSAEAITLGSNCVVTDNYTLHYARLLGPKDFGLEKGQHFEFYAKAIQAMMPKQSESGADSGEGNNEEQKSSSEQEKQNKSGGDPTASEGNSQEHSDGENGTTTSEGNSQERSDGGNDTTTSEGSSQERSEDEAPKGVSNESESDASALWEENSMAAAEINEMIKVLEASNQWGSISGNFAGKIIASTKVKIDYRRVIQLFRTEVLSSKRRLTRMRPNRRSGFENFGSVYRLTSRLLIAVDVSGSTTDEMVSRFFGVINKFFKYGIEEINVIQFDCDIKGEPIPMKKAMKGNIDITGRGGTNFQPVLDYARECKNYYQGLVILTDGYAHEPQIPDYFHMPILWVLPSEKLYQKHKSWMKKYGHACFIRG